MYFPKSKIQPNLYTNGNELQKLSSRENYIGFYFKTSRGQFFTGKTAGDGLNEQLVLTISTPSSATNLLDSINGQNLIRTTDTPIFSNLTQQQKNNFINPSNTLPNSISNFITPVSNISNDPLIQLSINQTSDTGGPYSKSLPVRKIPNFIQPVLKESDKQLGIIQRYFCKKSNESIFIEISLSDYSSLLNKSNTIAWDLYIPVSMLWYIKGNKEETFKTNKNLASLIERNNKWFGFVNYFKEDFNKFYLES
jgi:hypothetical protein